jgi:hypothetical protein
MVHEMVEIEKKGTPAVLLVSGRFKHDAIASARAFGMPGVRYVVVPWLYRNLDRDRAIQQTEAAFETLAGELTAEVDAPVASAKLKPTQVERFEGSNYADAFQVMNREFLNRDWGDGFPLLPATQDAVEKMLKGTCLPPDHVVCDLPPGYGLATVEKIAINSAMAGASPEHMPLIIGALKAVSQMDPDRVKGFLMSTSSHASMLLVNGPIAKELDINSKGACMGPGRQNRANLAVGRAYTLCLKNIGYWYPGEMDMDTIGSVRKFSVCIAENEDASPWEPFHVEQGYEAGDSVITVMATKGEVDVADQGNSTAEGLLKTIAYNSIFSQWDLVRPGRTDKGSAMETIVLVPPDIARPAGEAGFTKKGAKEFIHMHAQFSLGKMVHYYPLQPETIPAHWRWLLKLSEKELHDIWMPVRESADRYRLICVGADRAKPIIIPSMPVRPESVNVDQYRAR